VAKHLVNIASRVHAGLRAHLLWPRNIRRFTLMKTLTTLILVVALITLPVQQCSAPPMPPPDNNFSAAVGIILAVVVVAVAGTAIYVVVKCARKLNQKPPMVESSTNNVTWTARGQMQIVGDEFQFTEPATNAVMFYRARL